MAKGIELGLIGELPCIKSNNIPSPEKLKEKQLYASIQRNQQFSSRVEQESAKHPLNMLEYDVHNPDIYNKFVLPSSL